MNALFAAWRQKSAATLKALQAGFHPKEVSTLAEDLLAHYASKPLIDKYDVYQHLMDYWGGDHAGRLLSHRRRRLEGRDLPHHREGQEGQGEGQGWACDLVPKDSRRPLLRQEQEAITQLEAEWKASPPA